MKNTVKDSAGRLFTPSITGLAMFAFTLPAMALNPIQIENAIPPVAADYQWNASTEVNPTNQHTIEGYADQVSVGQGGIIKFFVNADTARNTQYTLTIYRLGYYSGAGARRMTTQVNLTSVNQVIPLPDPTSGLVECDWSESYALTIPSNWTSGVYIATLVGTTTHERSYIPFVVKQPNSTAPYLFQTSDTTWQAYNGWGGKSLYAYNSTDTKQAYKVSYNRPYEGNGFGSLGNFELQTLRFLEKNGYDVTYQANSDTHTGGSVQLTQHKAYLSVGHDEYWSKAMRDTVEAARAQGLSLGFFGANAAYWQMRFENSTKGAANRTVVAYKELAANDPIGNPSLVTAKWRDPLYANRPENALVGIMYTYDPVNANIVISNAAAAPAPHWIFTGTGLQNGSTLPGLLGYEVDSNVSNGKAPANLVILGHSVADAAQAIYGDMGIYTQTCSIAPCVNATATVFATGSMQWAWGLDSYRRPTNLENPAAQQMTHNVLARMVNVNASLPALPPNSNVEPTFFGGSTNLTVVQGSPSVDLRANLHVSDTNAGQVETWSQSVAPSHGTLVFSGATASSGSADIIPGGTITYQPAAGYSGTDSFTVQVSDGVATATRTFNVTVNPANIAPTFVGGTTSLTVTQDSAAVDLKPNLHVSDTNVGQTETWRQSIAPSHGTLVFSGATATSGTADIAPGGTITYQPATGYSGPDSFSIQVSDGALTATRTFTVTVVSSNVAPTFVGGTTAITVIQNSAAVDLKPNLHVSDTNINQIETWSQSKAPSHGTLVLSSATARSGSTNITPGGVITYKPSFGYTGPDSFSVRVSDGVTSTTRTFNVTVNRDYSLSGLVNSVLFGWLYW